MSKKSLLIISHDVVGHEMAGPGIRYYHLARVLSQTIETVLAIPKESPPGFEHPDFTIVYYSRTDWHSIAGQYASAEICFLPSDTASDFSEIGLDDTIIIIDGYNPLMAEWLAQASQFGEAQAEAYWRDRMRQLSRQYQIGDFFVCASERQRDWWLGLLEAHGRLNPKNFNADPSLRQLIDVVPYGLPQEPPHKRESLIKDVWENIYSDDKLILWGGGLWPWLDSITAIRAVAKVWETRQDVKLIFPGTKHPNPLLDGLPTQNEDAYSVAQELGILDKGVFFGDWIPYKEWANVLLECDIALTLHYDTVETRLAFRSRVLEYIWANLPTIATCGDATSEIIKTYEIGSVVGYEDVEGVFQAISIWLEQGVTDKTEMDFQQARTALAWGQCAKPLINFCEHPRKSADRMKQNVRQLYPVDNDNKLDKLNQQLERISLENAALQSTIQGYEQGKFIRFMKWIKTLLKKG